MAKNNIVDLEEKVDRAIELIAGLKEKNIKLERKNESLSRKLEDLQIEFDSYRKEVEKKLADASGSRSEFDGAEVKKRLSKLAGKLAALEDSWI